MAALSASHFVSTSSIVSRSSSWGSETKNANLAQIGMRNQTLTHNGLRPLHNLDLLRMRSHVKAIARQALIKSKKTESDGVSGKIVCGKGMNLVFVGAEVGPWSKTGGLGDVLGGLPPAMAVS